MFRYKCISSRLNVKHLFVKFTVGPTSFIIGGVYLPSSSPYVFYEAHISSVDNLISKYPNHKFIIRGDYNLPEVLWNDDYNGLIYLSFSPVRAQRIPEAFADNYFFQKNNVLNIKY